MLLAGCGSGGASSTASAPMDEQAFWRLIDEARREAGGDLEGQAELLVEWEAVSYVAVTAYDGAGVTQSDPGIRAPSEPAGEESDEETVDRVVPRLAAKFG